MGGGLMQLVAYGAQDIYLTGNPQITFFKVVYRRHTNFSMEAIEQTLNGTYAVSSRQTSTISRNGDLVKGLWWENTVATNQDFNLANPGYTQFDNIELEIGGQRIDKLTGNYMAAWAELTQPNPTGLSVASNAAIANGTWTLFQKMALAGGVTDGGNTMAAVGVHCIPVPFWFCRNAGLALPLIALQYHEVKVNVTWGSAVRTGTFAQPKLYADYVYLDTEERRRFAQVSHEYLIEQVQHQSQSSASTHELNFNHPVKELIWTGAVTDGLPATIGASTVTYQLKLNGHDRFSARPVQYFTRAQVWEHHTGYGGVSTLDSIGVYSFALKPEEHQPSGTCNFSRIDNAQLVASSATALEIYAVNYNVLRVMSGMGGLAYSN
jgi:hypothetical protein